MRQETVARVPLTRPYVDQAEADAAAAALQSGFVVQGPRVKEFERLVAEWVGARHALAVSSATTGLHLALAALDVGAGDEVLVPSFTFPATGNVVLHQGATPVLVDVRTDDHAIDVEDARRKITSRTRAIMPVDPFGLPYDADGIGRLAEEHGLAIVEDAACAIGATYNGRPAGGLGTIGVFSFHGRKIITTGEGGMVVTDDDDLAARLGRLRNHGAERNGPRLTFVEPGFNYRLSDIAGAIGVAQMGKLAEIVSQRRSLAGLLSERLAGVDGLTPQAEPAGRVHAYQSFVVLLDEGLDRDGVVERLKDHGVESTIGTYALHMEPVFQKLGYRDEDLPGARALLERSLTLPLFPGMSDGELDQVATSVTDVLREV